MIGSQSFVLYDDSTFYIETSADGLEGNYQIDKDVVRLKYFDRRNANWPEIMLIRKNYFISQDSLDSKRYLKIARDK